MAQDKSIATRRERGEIERPIESWDTFRDMERMMRDFFTSPFSMMRRPQWLSEFTTRFTPEVDLRETDQNFVLSATIPGMSKDDIDIDVTKDSITISGERRTEQEEKPGEKYHVRQQSYGAFRVSYALPSDVKIDEVKATCHNGVLTVEMPKTQAVEAHKVTIEEK